MLAACLLTTEKVTLHHVPDIADVRVMLAILENLGVSVSFSNNCAELQASEISTTRLDQDLCSKVRSSILCAGPLVAKQGHVEFYPPGGDFIGHRRLDTHFHGFSALGYDVQEGAFFTVTKTPSSKGVTMVLDEASVTATENIMMAACLTEGLTEIYHAACEPHITDLGNLLNAMGANIEGLGTNRLRIEGVKELQGATVEVSPDYIEVGSYIAAAAITGGSITVEGLTDNLVMKVIERPFQRMNVHWQWSEKGLHYENKDGLHIQKDLHQPIPKIEDGIWPAFPSDLMSVAIVLATQAEGTVLFFEKLFESRMYFVDQLIGMGASMVQCDPHRVLVSGPSALRGNKINSPDIRAGMALILAALCADGETRIDNIQMIDRGYEQLDEKLRSMGAVIERIDS